MKVHEINRRIDRYQNWVRKITPQSRQAYIILISNIYQEGKMIYRMCEVNLLTYKKIQKKHVHCFQRFKLDSPVYNVARIKRSMDQLETQFMKLENLYITIRQPYPKKVRTEFYERLQMKRQHESIANYFFGLANGISLSLILVSILVYAQSSVSSLDPRFTRDFPVWRAVAYVIMYLWVFALNVLVFQKYRIDYQLVFGFKQMTPRSSFALALASGFTFVYMAFFIFYLLDLTDLVHSSSKIIYWFPLIMWGLMLGYLLNPLPIFNFHGRIYFFKQILQTIASPFMRIHFNVIFITQQFVSMILPFSDIIYTFCYYIGQDLNNQNSNQCKASLHSAQYFGLFIFTYRIIQSLKVAYENKEFLWTRQMFIVLKGLANIFILFISLFSPKNNSLIIVWYVAAIPVLLFNYYVDLKWDWGLLQPNSPNKFLRKQIAFLPFQYYIIFGVNLIFRVSALLTLSQNIIYELNLYPFYLIFIVSVIEIIRRFFWNIIKVQRQHVLNCQKFQVRTDYEQQQEIVMNCLDQNDLHRKISKQQKQLESLRVSQQILNLNDHIQRKRQMRKKIQQWYQKNKMFLQNIESYLEQRYKTNKLSYNNRR